jgi:hypothetical protein
MLFCKATQLLEIAVAALYLMDECVHILAGSVWPR